ncbi:MAG: cysteine desulfurase [Bacteroidales bacterium]|nr:cysteine desulfurase [Bacteroidales bacterium]
MAEALDITKIREDFPILSRTVAGRPLIYLDNAATSQVPRCVVEGIEQMYYTTKANVHRGVHTLSQEATDLVEATREKVREYINAESIEEVIFTRGTTEAINLVASSYGDRFCNGDEIILTTMEHHANIVPWQLLQRNKRLRISVVPMNAAGELDINAYEDMFSDDTRFVSIAHVSNVLGTINPVKQMIEIAHRHNVPVLIDGAQAIPHMKVDVRYLNADFYAFSAHKMYGPSGVGVLYGKKHLLEKMPPYQGGGEMIGTVSFDKTTFAALPFKFEAGTPDFVDIAAFSRAIDYIKALGIENIAAHEQTLLKAATEGLMQIPDIRIFGTAEHKDSVLSFLVGDVSSYDIGILLDKLGVAVRTGHHCAQPLMHRLGIEGTVRASFAVYNTLEEVEQFVAATARVAKMFTHK